MNASTSSVLLLLLLLLVSAAVQLVHAQDCETDSECMARNTYCQKTGCTGKGVCTRKPLLCPSTPEPVCGCNGVTYLNPCTAQYNGQNIAFAGQCECKQSPDCPDRSYMCLRNISICDNDAGKCAVKPRACPIGIIPVCGCNGQTYDNECWAHYYGVNVAYIGQCKCKDNRECPVDGTYCAKTATQCNIAGVCQQKPVNCPKLWKPVCGCDAVTYPNECEANANGVNVASFGPCVCKENSECWYKHHYCAKNVTNCAGNGKCMEMPKICSDRYSPVCGCDLKTYGNACMAAAAGMNVLFAGTCECTNTAHCAAPGMFCFKNATQCTSVGLCQYKPKLCPDVIRPVCGCNGVSYSNACEAHRAGTTVKHSGRCECKDNNGCTSTEFHMFCAKGTGKCDDEGICEIVPESCPPIDSPQCGCDAHEYENECTAHMNRVNVMHAGPCRQVSTEPVATTAHP